MAYDLPDGDGMGRKIKKKFVKHVNNYFKIKDIGALIKQIELFISSLKDQLNQ
jgi:hypothetical protein